MEAQRGQEGEAQRDDVAIPSWVKTQLSNTRTLIQFSVASWPR